MKTIEERAKAYEEILGFGYRERMSQFPSDAFIAGARSEHEELTRWHDPEKELPEPMKDVLVKCSSDTYAVDFYVPELECFFGESATYMEVVGWREIHE